MSWIWDRIIFFLSFFIFFQLFFSLYSYSPWPPLTLFWANKSKKINEEMKIFFVKHTFFPFFVKKLEKSTKLASNHSKETEKCEKFEKHSTYFLSMCIIFISIEWIVVNTFVAPCTMHSRVSGIAIGVHVAKNTGSFRLHNGKYDK